MKRDLMEGGRERGMENGEEWTCVHLPDKTDKCIRLLEAHWEDRTLAHVATDTSPTSAPEADRGVYVMSSTASVMSSTAVPLFFTMCVRMCVLC